mgnify:CR=1 FL=1
MSHPAHRPLSADQLQHFGAEIEALRARTVADLGERDARYIRNILKAVRFFEVAGRGLLMVGAFLPSGWLAAAWIAGIALLAISKILDNMELGHNVMHGQFDWMGDPHLNGKTFEWDIVGTSDNWRKTHNFRHHTYTNIHGMDDDLGYGVLRLFPEQPWSPGRLGQPLYALIFALLFQWGVAVQDLRIGRLFKGRITGKELARQAAPTGRKMRRQLLKDYVFFPLLAGPGFLTVFAGNFIANGIRNVWTYTVIFCGHFTEKTAVFPAESLKGETQGQWYLRQLKGSSNLTGSKLLHIMTGNLSHQIEHHLFPTIPARRYAAIAVEVRALCEKYGQTYNTGTMAGQFSTVVARLWKYRKPDGARRMASAAA